MSNRLDGAGLRDLRRMRIAATGLLIFMAALFLLAHSLEDRHAGWGYLAAFAEAGMVGGLADWFAVTALFRHPLGLPIPHTAIIPRNKDRIGDTLAAFLKDNFLTPPVISRRMRDIDMASAVGRFLARPPGGEGKSILGSGRLIGDMLAALDQERLGGLVQGALRRQLERLELASLAGRMLEAMMREGRHRPVIEEAIRWAHGALADNEELVFEVVEQRANKLMKWTGLDETIAKAIVNALHKLLEDIAADPEHSVRLKAEEALQGFVHRLQHDVEFQKRVEEWKQEVLENPAVGDWISGLWEQARQALLAAARDPQATMSRYLGSILAQFGQTLQDDANLNRQVNRFARRAAVGTAASYGDQIVTLVSDTVRGWDVRTVTGRIENAVGKDLQYIRINGTLVGGLVGVTLHLLTEFF